MQSAYDGAALSDSDDEDIRSYVFEPKTSNNLLDAFGDRASLAQRPHVQCTSARETEKSEISVAGRASNASGAKRVYAQIDVDENVEDDADLEAFKRTLVDEIKTGNMYNRMMHSGNDDGSASENVQGPRGTGKMAANGTLFGSVGLHENGNEEHGQMSPNGVPMAFMDNVRTDTGEIDFERLQNQNELMSKNSRMKKLHQPIVGMDDEDKRVEDDYEGFLYETCMNPQEYRRRSRLRQRANQRKLLEYRRKKYHAKQAKLKAKKAKESVKNIEMNEQVNALGDSASTRNSALVVVPSANADKELANFLATGSVRHEEKSCRIVHSESKEEASVNTQEEEEDEEESEDEHKVTFISNNIDDDPRDYEEYAEGQSHGGCLLCRRGTQGTAPIPIQPLDNLIRNYVSNRGYKDEEDLAYDMEEQFEKCIREPANRSRKANESEIPLLTAEQIYYHMKYHDQDPSIWLCDTLRTLRSHREQLLHAGVYRVPKTRTLPGSHTGPAHTYMNSKARYDRIRPQDVRVNEKYHKMMLETMKLEMSLYKSDASKMTLYNKHKTVKYDEVQPWLNTNRPLFTQTNSKKGIWSDCKQKY